MSYSNETTEIEIPASAWQAPQTHRSNTGRIVFAVLAALLLLGLAGLATAYLVFDHFDAGMQDAKARYEQETKAFESTVTTGAPVGADAGTAGPGSAAAPGPAPAGSAGASTGAAPGAATDPGAAPAPDPGIPPPALRPTASISATEPDCSGGRVVSTTTVSWETTGADQVYLVLDGDPPQAVGASGSTGVLFDCARSATYEVRAIGIEADFASVTVSG